MLLRKILQFLKYRYSAESIFSTCGFKSGFRYLWGDRTHDHSSSESPDLNAAAALHFPRCLHTASQVKLELVASRAVILSCRTKSRS